jgi:hypothetical protein
MTEYTRDKIALVHIKESYQENKWMNYKYYDNVQDALKDVTNKETCSLEVLTKPIRRIYMDIENIPRDKPYLIYSIINRFHKFMKFTDTNYCLTQNNNSTRHDGLSYHIIYPYIMNVGDMRKAIIMFMTKNTEYETFIDYSVYDFVRLFRLPMNGRVMGNGINNDDYHNIIRGTIEDSFIQNIYGLPTIIGDLLPEGFNEFVTPEFYERKTRTSNCVGFDELSSLIMGEFRKLTKSFDELRSQNHKIETMNDVLFNKILSLEKMKDSIK